jgi:hypothetical protein
VVGRIATSTWLARPTWRLNLSLPLASAIIAVFIVICILVFLSGRTRIALDG